MAVIGQSTKRLPWLLIVNLNCHGRSTTFNHNEVVIRNTIRNTVLCDSHVSYRTIMAVDIYQQSTGRRYHLGHMFQYVVIDIL